MKHFKSVMVLAVIAVAFVLYAASPAFATSWPYEVGTYECTTYASTDPGNSNYWIMNKTTIYIGHGGTGPAQLKIINYEGTSLQTINYSPTRTINSGQTVTFNDFHGWDLLKGYCDVYMRRGSSDSWHTIW